uniref:60S ribosomal protein L36 n=1 Tax=Strombidinopsis acuminata TaxID=141414 RepID=A0A7S3WLB3_9SPIT|mmetsp:Transcript_43967/g.59639  ORF Transcript_43967/g.59639 Transcript_43967/m.59639 type:complete len:107 (+) Transcript_43967:60-380(+)|eukprot:CAMPEP_0176344458 /NCGR_PEP_ID=MMETSP0126-20121128/4718_1 /TAXON_ID=141414 ORGANISM="Strombidinopsis acuminatum, Strain SPMC142" /NCGR_SAMPLE_ID=MMETSP0126 /ASSEMBLY_ACC=CAM_ASM_000229 /LENGTH=106 /DNA_ID=CAMNT_0017690935 /DNA_START=58 /DNA_END=378 /DNA_ORIENTATION=-
MEQKTGLFVGLNHGFVITKPAKDATKAKVAYRKGSLGKRVAAVREVIREVVGFTPLERKMMELIRTGVPAKEKRANKLARARLGSYKRSLVKRTMVDNIIMSQKKK